MPLEVKFTVTTPNLRFQEDSPAAVKLTNSGREPIKVSNPSMAPTLLRLRVVNVKGGGEKLYQRRLPPGALPPMEQPLGPGKSHSLGMMLLDLPGEIDPGEYDISIGCRYSGDTESAESAPVRVKIRPTTARNLGLEGTANQVFSGVWINLAEDPQEVVRTTFDLVAGVGARDLRFVTKANLNSSPVVSAPPNQDACPHSWIAWIEGTEVKAVHLHDTEGPSPVRSISLPGGEARIVAPLHTDPTPENDGRPSGGLLLWLGEGEKAESQLQALKLTPGAMTPQARTPLPAPRPLWMGSFVRADGRRLVLVVRASEGKASLTLLPWPGVPGAAKKLGEWKGEFMGAGTAMDSADVLHGALLLRTGAEAHSDLERIDFDVDAKDGFTAKEPVVIPNSSEDPVAQAIVRLSDEGVFGALFRGTSGAWSFCDGKAATPLPEPFKSSAYPLDLCFRDATTPILIAARKEFGFHLYRTDGSLFTRRR